MDALGDLTLIVGGERRGVGEEGAQHGQVRHAALEAAAGNENPAPPAAGAASRRRGEFNVKRTRARQT
eukprot:751026-Hanusia_phi.AAC.1